MINVNTAEDSEQLLKCTEFCGLPVEVTPHSSLNCSKGVIKNGWLKGSTARELVDDIDCVIKAEQILIKKGEKGNLVKTGTWILTFNTPTCPAHLDVYWMRLPVRVFRYVSSIAPCWVSAVYFLWGRALSKSPSIF